jgi:PEP-CTERM motif-containing protein
VAGTVVLACQPEICWNFFVKRTLWTSLLVVTLISTHLGLLSDSSAADFSAIWDGGNGNWGDSVHWSTNPNYPNNTGGVTYDAAINSGNVTLDRDITIQRFFLNGGLSGDFALNLNESFNWTGGAIHFPTTINLATGSTSTISNGDMSGTLNNSGTLNQAGSFDLLGPFNSQTAGIINNLPGATWNMQPGSAINPLEPFVNPGVGGAFNNAGNLVVSLNGNSNSRCVLFTALNNSGNVTINTIVAGRNPEGSFRDFFAHHGTASGSFNVAAETMLVFGNYTLTSGATITGLGSTEFQGTLIVSGNVTVNTNLADHVNFVTTSTLLVEKGANLTLTGTFTQVANLYSPITRLAGGTIMSAQPLNFQAGSLTGSGTINGDVISNATILPGASAGTLIINGNLSLQNSSKLVMEAGGLTQGTQYDYLAISGLVGLDGTLELHMLNGFQLQLDPSQTFTLLTSKVVLSGAFDNVANGSRLTTADGFASFQVNYGVGSPYGANNVVLSDPQAVPEPASIFLLAAGAAIIGLFRVRRK